jgi:hypothetical protein
LPFEVCNAINILINLKNWFFKITVSLPALKDFKYTEIELKFLWKYKTGNHPYLPAFAGRQVHLLPLKKTVLSFTIFKDWTLSS